METVLDTQAIQELLPHRYPFLLVDRIIELVPRESQSARLSVCRLPMGQHGRHRGCDPLHRNGRDADQPPSLPWHLY